MQTASTCYLLSFTFTFIKPSLSKGYRPIWLMREVSLENKGRGPWRNMNTDGRRVFVPRPKDQDKKQVCDVKGSKQDCFHRNNYQVYHFWINFLKVQSLSLCSLANVSCMPNSSFCRWQQTTWWLIYIVRESRLEKIVRFFVILFNTFKCSSFTCMYSVNLWI